MKILIISRAFFPIIAPRSFRATELAKEMAKKGNCVTVLTHKQKYDYSIFEKEQNLKIEDFVKGRWKEIQGSNILNKAFRYLLNLFFLFPDIQLAWILKKELQNYSDFDLIISIAVPYPIHWGVALARKSNPQLCSKWIADCGDPFMGNKETRFKHPFYFQLIENWFCTKPDYLTVPIREAINAYPKKCKDIIRVIPQGFNFEEFKKPNTHVKNNIPTFAYAGGLSKGIRDPGSFLNYLNSIDIPFRFIIYTKNQNLLTPYKKKLGKKLDVRDYLPREELLDELSRMDFLINFQNKNNVQSPSKLIDYSITGRPILSITPSFLRKDIILEFINGNYTNKFIIRNLENYNISNVVKQFIDLTLE